MSLTKTLLSFVFLLSFALGASGGPVPQPALQAAAGEDLYLPLLLQADPPLTQIPDTATATPGTTTVTPSPSATSATPPTPTPTDTPSPTPDTSFTFAVIGDYGSGTQDEADVAALVDSWNVDFVLTLGDNNYPDGEAETIDERVGKYYSEYIYPYKGSYGPGADTNRFFPALGNHDYYSTPTQDDPQPYLEYFTLPGNERYYQFTWENVDFFALNSYYLEPDGRIKDSIQYKWLQEQLAQSTSDWQVVYFHDTPFSSMPDSDEPHMDWPFKDWGVDLVLAAHVHNYERLDYQGLAYVVNGLGGDAIDQFPAQVVDDDTADSQVQFDDDYGAMHVTVDSSGIHARFIDRNGGVQDTFVIP